MVRFINDYMEIFTSKGSETVGEVKSNIKSSKILPEVFGRRTIPPVH